MRFDSIWIALIIYTYISGIQSNEQYALSSLLTSIHKLLAHIRKNYQSVTLDIVFSLRVLEGQCKLLSEDNGKGQIEFISPNVLREINEIGAESGKLANMAIPHIHERDREYFHLMKKLTIVPWKVFHPHRVVNLSLRWLRSQYPPDFTENDRLRCMSELMGGTKKNATRCEVSEDCLLKMLSPGQAGYHLQHQIFYTIVVQKMGCEAQVKDYLVARTRFRDLEQIQHEFCTNAFYELEEIVSVHGLQEDFRDLFLKTEFVCPSIGYLQFMKSEWLEAILSWQSKDGCFPSPLNSSVPVDAEFESTHYHATVPTPKHPLFDTAKVHLFNLDQISRNPPSKNAPLPIMHPPKDNVLIMNPRRKKVKGGDLRADDMENKNQIGIPNGYYQIPFNRPVPQKTQTNHIQPGEQMSHYSGALQRVPVEGYYIHAAQPLETTQAPVEFYKTNQGYLELGNMAYGQPNLPAIPPQYQNHLQYPWHNDIAYANNGLHEDVVQVPLVVPHHQVAQYESARRDAGHHDSEPEDAYDTAHYKMNRGLKSVDFDSENLQQGKPISKCSAHSTSVAALALAVYLRYVIDPGPPEFVHLRLKSPSHHYGVADPKQPNPALKTRIRNGDDQLHLERGHFDPAPPLGKVLANVPPPVQSGGNGPFYEVVREPDHRNDRFQMDPQRESIAAAGDWQKNGRQAMPFLRDMMSEAHHYMGAYQRRWGSRNAPIYGNGNLQAGNGLPPNHVHKADQVKELPEWTVAYRENYSMETTASSSTKATKSSKRERYLTSQSTINLFVNRVADLKDQTISTASSWRRYKGAQIEHRPVTQDPEHSISRAKDSPKEEAMQVHIIEIRSQLHNDLDHSLIVVTLISVICLFILYRYFKYRRNLLRSKTRNL